MDNNRTLLKWKDLLKGPLVALFIALSALDPARGLAQEPQVRGYWIDPSTGLMWTARDIGKDVSHNSAMRYCRNLRLAGYPDWRVPTLTELGMIYDRNANAPGLVGRAMADPSLGM